MRYITANPEFTWNGTLFIVGAFTVAGLVHGLALLGRRAELRRRLLTPLRVLAVLTLFPLSFGGGAALFPTIILGALSISHRQWPRWIRTALVFLVVVNFVSVFVLLLEDISVPRALIGVLWAVLIYVGLMLMATLSLGPQRDGWMPPRWLFYLGALLVVVQSLVAIPLLIGMP